MFPRTVLTVPSLKPIAMRLVFSWAQIHITCGGGGRGRESEGMYSICELAYSWSSLLNPSLINSCFYCPGTCRKPLLVPLKKWKRERESKVMYYAHVKMAAIFWRQLLHPSNRYLVQVPNTNERTEVLIISYGEEHVTRLELVNVLDTKSVRVTEQHVSDTGHDVEPTRRIWRRRGGGGGKSNIIIINQY